MKLRMKAEAELKMRTKTETELKMRMKTKMRTRRCPRSIVERAAWHHGARPEAESMVGQLPRMKGSVEWMVGFSR